MINYIDEDKNIHGGNTHKTCAGELFQGLTSNDIFPIHKSYEPIKDISQIPELVETPLVSAVEKLFQKKIKTIDTSANTDKIWIQIYYDVLNPTNRGIAEKIGGTFSLSGWSGGRPIICFALPPIKSTPVKYIEDWGNWIADSFQKQDFVVIKKSWTLAEMAKFRRIPGSTEAKILEDMKPILMTRSINYNPQTKIFTTI
ncbi:MAG: hypothetical protein NT085_03525 [candidate division SR1 bacterium]|nr:hypothetical protein [candidate division SR1 bacterium]